MSAGKEFHNMRRDRINVGTGQSQGKRKQTAIPPPPTTANKEEEANPKP
jgi:hypothetical protein